MPALLVKSDEQLKEAEGFGKTVECEMYRKIEDNQAKAVQDWFDRLYLESIPKDPWRIPSVLMVSDDFCVELLEVLFDQMKQSEASIDVHVDYLQRLVWIYNRRNHSWFSDKETETMFFAEKRTMKLWREEDESILSNNKP